MGAITASGPSSYIAKISSRLKVMVMPDCDEERELPGSIPSFRFDENCAPPLLRLYDCH
jgi:hypothetical protein